MSLRMIVNNVEICEGTNGKYYRLNGDNYDIHFPLCWAIEDENSKSGPANCGNCFTYGHYNGVFVAYCANCTKYIYNNERGYYNESNSKPQIELKNFDYMKGVSLDQIGDSVLNNDHEEEEDYSILDYLAAYDKTNLVYDYEICLTPSTTDSSLDKEEDDEEKYQDLKEINENCQIEEFIEIENAIQKGNITFRERMYNTINMCGNN